MTGTPLTPHNQHQRTPSSCIMSASTTTMSGTPNSLPKSRFPRLQECAHFHYEVSTIDIPKNFRVIMCRETDDINKSNSSSSSSGYNSLTASTMSGLSNGIYSLNIPYTGERGFEKLRQSQSIFNPL